MLRGLSFDDAECVLTPAGGGATDAGLQAAQRRTSPTVVSLTEAQRVELQRITGDRIDMAYTDFVSAIHAHKDAIRAAARSQAEFLSLLADVGMGFAIPSMAKGIAALVDKIPVKAPDFIYHAAIALQNSDFAKALFTGATKTGIMMVKDNAFALFGETEDDVFLDKLQGQFRRAFTATNEGLPALSDDQVVAVCAAFDPTVTDKGAYKAQIAEILKKFQADVKSIGVKSARQALLGNPAKEVWANQQAVYVWHGEQWRVALVHLHGSEDALRSEKAERWQFVKWVSPEMQMLALAKTRDVVGDLRYFGPSEGRKIDDLPEDDQTPGPHRARPH